MTSTPTPVRGRRSPRPGGFTLVELMIALAVAAILVAVAMPAFNESFQRSRRADAAATLLQAAQWMERHRAENNGSYESADARMPAPLRVSPPAPGAPLYRIAVDQVTATTYRLSATPVAGSPMANDACGTFTVDHTGQRTTAGGQTTGAPFTRCWRR